MKGSRRNRPHMRPPSNTISAEARPTPSMVLEDLTGKPVDSSVMPVRQFQERRLIPQYRAVSAGSAMKKAAIGERRSKKKEQKHHYWRYDDHVPNSQAIGIQVTRPDKACWVGLTPSSVDFGQCFRFGGGDGRTWNLTAPWSHTVPGPEEIVVLPDDTVVVVSEDNEWQLQGR